MFDTLVDDWLIEPKGNALLLSSAEKLHVIDTGRGLGPILQAIGGAERVNDKLFGYFQAIDLCSLSICSRALYALIMADDGLWRDLAIGTLSDSILDARLKEFNSWIGVVLGRQHAKKKFGRIFSDAVHRPLQCARTVLDPYWLSRDNVSREVEKISVDDFVTKYELPKIPVLLKGYSTSFANGIERWRNGLKDGMTTLNNKQGRFRCGARSIQSEAFASYSTSGLANLDESPLYIFDARFAETFPELGKDYIVPEVFSGEGRDLFEHLGPAKRPDFRWVIAGAPRSGSKWHLDPNCTHAWNASLLGRKKWIMLPPWGAPPPGVFPSPDGGSVAQPVSLVEWFMEFYKITRKTRDRDLIEFIADVGDLVFVPSGWWHAVLNIDESFAVTQNYVSTSNLPRAMRFFEQKTDQISGLSRRGGQCDVDDRRKTFAKEFREAIPKKFADMCNVDIASDNSTSAFVAWSALVPKQQKMDECTQPSAGSGFAFSFNFAPEPEDNENE